MKNFIFLPKFTASLLNILPKIPILTRYSRKNTSKFADNQQRTLLSFAASKNVILRQLFCFALILGFAVPGFAQNTQNNTDAIDMRFTADILKKELFAKTPEERRFCDYVIQKRDDGTIPSSILYGVYQKAISKDRNMRFTYFKTALETVCRREGIALYPSSVRTSPMMPSWSLSFPSFRGLFQRN